MNFRGLVWKRLRKMTFFWSEIRSGFGEPGGTPPPRIPRSTPRGLVQGRWTTFCLHCNREKGAMALRKPESNWLLVGVFLIGFRWFHASKFFRQYQRIIIYLIFAGADPGFFLGGGALICCSTSTPINHIVFFCSCIRKPQVISAGGGAVRTPCTLPLDPPLICLILIFSYLSVSSGLQDQHLHSTDSPSISSVRNSLINFFDGQCGEIASHTCFLTQPKRKQRGTIIGQRNVKK